MVAIHCIFLITIVVAVMILSMRQFERRLAK